MDERKMEQELLLVKEERPYCAAGRDCTSTEPAHYMQYQHTSPDKQNSSKEEAQKLSVVHNTIKLISKINKAIHSITSYII